MDPSVKEIGLQAFEDCSQLRIVELFRCFRPPRPFRSRHHLRTVELYEGLERIDADAFHECISLQRINIPSTVKEIGLGAFEGCSQLRNVELHEGLERIDWNAFRSCTSLTII